MKRILIVVGTRPNFIKITQFKKVASVYEHLEIKIAHTGQHYEQKLSNIFFQQFNLQPDFFLNISPTSPNSQMAEIMIGLEKIIGEYKPDLVMVPGDVNSTFAAAITANKCTIKLAHIESGLRSFDRTMPEEFNRIATDVLADYLFVTEQSGVENLKREGRKDTSIFFVGNTMIDTLVAFDELIQKSPVLSELNIEMGKFILMTMHRPSNVDTRDGLEKLFSLLEMLCKRHPVVFPIHPRTVKNMERNNLLGEFRIIKNLIITEPMDYFSFQKLVSETLCIITDSGGVQEESTFRKIPCLTLRPNTERPITVEVGTNEIIPYDLPLIEKKISEIEKGNFKKGTVPPLWDGNATERIITKISRIL
ncbi:MAG: UDP-N-acetylglucosamine 2-epimerase (non-hydrolyzing) [Bacteroidetes bacterium]|nr:UDP-N-acetylglucosamine 2-epimerase (non-hydrolyzing) [Bacteroidota bacterium]